MSARQKKQQGAVEFITTYGWAIIAVVVALGVLYSLGIFSIGANGSTGCSVVAGFSCTKPVLYSSGLLTMGLGQIGIAKTITATGCSHNSTSPVTWQSSNVVLQSGQISNFSFSCPGVQKSLGSSYQGTLWIQYSVSSGSTVTQEIGAVRTTVQGSGVPGIPSGTPYLTIALSNQQSSGTGPNFQQMIQVFTPSYSSYEASDLGNIRFYQGTTELHSWCESGCTAGQSATFWVLLPTGIGASSNMNIYMAFLTPNSVEYDGSYAGEAPQLSSSYAKYDNGGLVFGNYQNFFGTTCPIGWTCSNPLNHPGMVSNGLTLGPAGGIWVEPNTFSFSSPGIIDFYGSLLWNGYTSIGVGAPGLVVYSNDQYGNAVVTGLSYLASSPGTTITPSFQVGTFNAFSTTPTQSQYYVWSQIDTGNYSISQYNYQGGSQSSLVYPYLGSYAEMVLQDSAVNPAAMAAYWVRSRAYPPGGVMPGYSFGSVTTS